MRTNVSLVMPITATAVAQLILVGGPLVVGLIGGTAALVSVYFITFALLRGPVTVSCGVSTRLLADTAGTASRGDLAWLRAWVFRLSAVGDIGAVLAAIGGYIVMPSVIGFLYRSEFLPAAMVAGLGGAGVIAALTVLFLSQFLVTLGRTVDLALGWGVAVAVATAVILVLDGEPVLRVASGFAASELIAFVSVSMLAARRTAG